MTLAHNLLVRLLKARKERDEATKNLGNFYMENCMPCRMPFQGEEGDSLKCSSRWNIDSTCSKGESYREVFKQRDKAASRAGAALRNCLKYAEGREEE